MSSALPEFDKPPLTEVALSVQFEKLDTLDTAQLGWFWNTFRERFPKTETHASLDPVFEVFPATTPDQNSFRMELLLSLPSPRLWFQSESGNELVQIQSDRFVRNWRKREERDRYPRYSQLRELFRNDFGLLCQKIGEQSWGNVEPNQCEITYVNLIPAGQGWQAFGELDRILTLYNPTYSDFDLGVAEELVMSGKFVMKKNNLPIGRLHFWAKPVIRKEDSQRAIQLSLTARGAPMGDGIEGVLSFFDQGHDTIVRTFTSITTPAMHTIWERTR